MAEGDPPIVDPAKIKSSTDAFNNYNAALKNSSEEQKVAAATAKYYAEESRRAAEANSVLTDTLGKQTHELLTTAMGFKNLSNVVDVSAEFLKKFGVAAVLVGKEQGRSIINPVSESGDAIRAFSAELSRINDGMRQVIVVQNAARQSIVMLGGSLADGDAAAAKYPDTLRKMSGMLGISTKDLHSMSEKLRDVPGMMGAVEGSMTGVGTLAGTTVMPMAVLATTMRAFGMSAQEASEFGRRGLFEFGQEAGRTFKQIGLMADAQKQTGISGKVVTEQIEQASKGLAIFGQGSAVAAGVWTTFMTSLKGSGVPIAEIGNMVTRLTESFAGMSLQTRAAISSFSGLGGGRTAIGGALQMEINLRAPGGFEKNLEMMTSTLSKFAGGRIITLEEAAANPQLEAQFVVQRNMLAKLSGITSTEQQNRILETMQNVQRGGMSQLEGGKTLEDAFGKGKDVQTQQLTAIEKGFQLTQSAIGGAADKVIAGINSNMLLGAVSPEERERSTVQGMSLMGEGLARPLVPGEIISEKFKLGLDSLRDVVAEFTSATENLLDISGFKKTGISTMDIGGGGFENAFKRRGLRAGIAEKFPPEARLTPRPAYAAVPQEFSRPTEGPFFKIVDVIQKRDDVKVKLMEQMLAAVQQQAAGREMPFMPAGEATTRRAAPPVFTETGKGEGSFITVRVIGDQEELKQYIKTQIEAYKPSVLGH